MTGPFALTIDLEDWFHAENMRKVLAPEDWPNQAIRADSRMRDLMALLDRHQVRATVFVLGWLARRRPELIREIAQAGHEIACHGDNHDRLDRLSTAQLHADMGGAKRYLEDIAGAPVRGYRAPSFSIDERAMDVLAEQGFVYDSSVFPFNLNENYGRLAPAQLTAIAPGVQRHRTGIYEFALPMLALGRLQLPWAGGGYFRLLPGPVFRWGVRAIRRGGQPFVFYCHPWEFDPGQPVQQGLPAGKRWRHYVGQRRSWPRLAAVLRETGSATRLCDLLPAEEAG